MSRRKAERGQEIAYPRTPSHRPPTRSLTAFDVRGRCCSPARGYQRRRGRIDTTQDAPRRERGARRAARDDDTRTGRRTSVKRWQGLRRLARPLVSGEKRSNGEDTTYRVQGHVLAETALAAPPLCETSASASSSKDDALLLKSARQRYGRQRRGSRTHLRASTRSRLVWEVSLRYGQSWRGDCFGVRWRTRMSTRADAD